MPIAVTRRATALLAAVGALLLAAFAAAPQADASTIYACVKKHGGSARIVKKTTKCKKSESKLSWNSQGPAGPNGANGAPGTNGANGTNGADLTSQTPLASGKSESGAFAVGGGASATGYAATGISFAQPLAASIAANHVVFNTTTSTHCSGVGHADPGYVCLYESESSGMSFYVARDFKLDENAADPFGLVAFFEVKAAGGYVAGAWTVTAP